MVGPPRPPKIWAQSKDAGKTQNLGPLQFGAELWASFSVQGVWLVEVRPLITVRVWCG